MRKLIGTALLLVCGSVQAAILTVLAEGVVSGVDDTENLLPFDPLVPGVTEMTLSFQYESDQPTQGPFPTLGSYAALDPIQISSGNTTVSVPGAFIAIGNDFLVTNRSIFVDVWNAISSELPAGDPPRFFSAEMALVTESESVPIPTIDSIDLTRPQWPNGWERGEIVFVVGGLLCAGDLCDDITLAEVRAQITSVHVIPVPPVALLFPAGLIAGFMWMRRQSKFFA